MKLAIPVSLTVMLSETDTFRMHEKFKDNPIICLEGRVKGVVSDNPLPKMIENVKSYINSFWFVKNGELNLTNFSLSYTIENVDEGGDVWASRSFCRKRIFEIKN